MEVNVIDTSQDDEIGAVNGEGEVAQTSEEENWVSVPDYFPQKRAPVFLKNDSGCFKPGEYTKGVKWSPDGWCCLVGSEDMRLLVFELPQDLHPQVTSPDLTCHPSSPWGPPLAEIKVGDALYDFDWNPKMTTYEPDSYTLVTTCKNSPIQLRDAVSGTVKATYNCYDDVDEVRAANSVAFSPDGQRLLAGMRGEFRCFDVNRPGRICERKKLKRSKSEIDRNFRQTGIVSCFAFPPNSGSVMAAGSYDKNIGLYSFPDLELWSVVVLPAGSSGGVTNIKFTPDGSKLVASSRKDNLIRCWDTRMIGQDPYWTLERPAATTQRFYLDFDPSGRYLASGASDGQVRVWDVASDPGNPSLVLQWLAHEDCCTGVSFHPDLAFMASGSGQRHVEPLVINDSDEEVASGNQNPSKNDSSVGQENSLKIWWCGDYDAAEEASGSC